MPQVSAACEGDEKLEPAAQKGFRSCDKVSSKQEQPCSAGFGTAQGLAGQMVFTDQKRKHIA